MKTIVVHAMTAVFVLLSMTGVAAGEDVHFGYRFTEGQTGNYKVKFSQELDFGGFAMSNFVDLEVTVKCVGASDSLYSMEMLFSKVEASRMMMENMQNDPNAEKLVGKSVAFTVDPHGDVNDVSPIGYVEGWDMMKAGIEPIVENWYVFLPDKGLAEGQEWSESKEKEVQDNGMEVTTSAVYKFKEIKKEKGLDCARVEATVENILGGTNDTPQGTFAVDGIGEGKFELLFDSATATIVRLKGKVDMKMDLKPTAGGDAVETTVTFNIERELI